MSSEKGFRVEGDLVYTSHVINVEDALGRLIETSGMGAVIAPAGAGKTYVFSRLVRKFDDLRVIWIEPMADPTQRQLAAQMANAMAGPVSLRTRFQLYGFLTQELKIASKSGHVILVVDEAQRLGHKCVEDLRYLHDLVGHGFSLALLGGKKCWSVIEGDPMLRTRIRRATRMGYLKDADAIRMARFYHPIYKGASDSLLCDINRACVGRFRSWHFFTDEAASMCQDLGRERISQRIAKDTLRLLNGRSDEGRSFRDEEIEA